MGSSRNNSSGRPTIAMARLSRCTCPPDSRTPRCPTTADVPPASPTSRSSRALATGSELLVADDVSSALDARTEVELWESLRSRGVTVVGSSSKRAALERADAVVVLEDGRVAETGPWSDLSERWGHLAG